MSNEERLKAAGWKTTPSRAYRWTLDGIDFYTEDEALVVVLTAERDAAIAALSAKKLQLGRARDAHDADGRALMRAHKERDAAIARAERAEADNDALRKQLASRTEACRTALDTIAKLRRRGDSPGVLREQRDTAYERGLRRGLAIAREHYVKVDGPCACDMDTFDVDWKSAEAQMEREIEEAKR